MATRKNASKTSSRAKININIDEKSVSKTSKKAKSASKSLGKNMLVLVIVFLIIGLLLGVGASFYLTRSDCFEIIGQDELSLTLGENYVDEGCKVISFGRDISNEIEIETDLIVNADGSLTGDEIKTYYILYKSNDIKYGKIFTVTKIRLITFVEPSVEEEMDNSMQTFIKLTNSPTISLLNSTTNSNLIENSNLNSAYNFGFLEGVSYGK